MTRQRKWQIKKESEGLCIICGKPSVTKYHCETHRRSVNLRTREAERRRFNYKRRNLNSPSYSYQ